MTGVCKHIRASGLERGGREQFQRTGGKGDWSESWKRHFNPIAIGSRLLIKRGENVDPTALSRKKSRRWWCWDPGLSFGTGNHPTTAFCLGEGHGFGGTDSGGTAQAFLDLREAGSGDFAIAAVKESYAPVRAFDFDPRESTLCALARARWRQCAAPGVLTR